MTPGRAGSPQFYGADERSLQKEKPESHTHTHTKMKVADSPT